MRVLGVAAVVLTGMLAATAPGQGADLSTVEVTTNHESWYHVTPLNAPSALPPAGGVRPPSVPPEVPAISPFAANRLQVGLAGGVESARTYLKLAAGAIDGEVVGGVLRLPLDLDPAAGSLLPESAGLVACVARGFDVEAEGSFGPMPAVDCATTSPAVLGEGPDPVLLVDLAPFGFLVQTEGIALLPSAAEITAAGHLEGVDHWCGRRHSRRGNRRHVGGGDPRRRVDSGRLPRQHRLRGFRLQRFRLRGLETSTSSDFDRSTFGGSGFSTLGTQTSVPRPTTVSAPVTTPASVSRSARSLLPPSDSSLLGSPTPPSCFCPWD